MSDNPCSVCVVTVVTLVALFVAGIELAMLFGMPYRKYSIIIDSVSGLNLTPSKDLALDPQFNLTLRLASASPGRRACMDTGTYVQVSYRCIPLATSAAAPQRLCVGPRRSRDELVNAKGTGVRLPGFLMDSLAADLQSGVEAFDVMVRRSGGHDGNTLVASCGVRRV
ncbi:hypothetical protein VPH35_119488 [Triticum aestivum]|uniref:Late embryogenesis abundant protein LEA-2 subgroup domain-containing protein n=1 Tax=Aegilops tauschii TaxID=37682 RepID=R7WAP3_AEGTA